MTGISGMSIAALALPLNTALLVRWIYNGMPTSGGRDGGCRLCGDMAATRPSGAAALASVFASCFPFDTQANGWRSILPMLANVLSILTLIWVPTLLDVQTTKETLAGNGAVFICVPTRNIGNLTDAIEVYTLGSSDPLLKLCLGSPCRMRVRKCVSGEQPLDWYQGHLAPALSIHSLLVPSCVLLVYFLGRCMEQRKRRLEVQAATEVELEPAQDIPRVDDPNVKD